MLTIADTNTFVVNKSTVFYITYHPTSFVGDRVGAVLSPHSGESGQVVESAIDGIFTVVLYPYTSNRVNISDRFSISIA